MQSDINGMKDLLEMRDALRSRAQAALTKVSMSVVCFRANNSLEKCFCCFFFRLGNIKDHSTATDISGLMTGQNAVQILKTSQGDDLQTDFGS